MRFSTSQKNLFKRKNNMVFRKGRSKNIENYRMENRVYTRTLGEKMDKEIEQVWSKCREHYNRIRKALEELRDTNKEIKKILQRRLK